VRWNEESLLLLLNIKCSALIKSDEFAEKQSHAERETMEFYFWIPAEGQLHKSPHSAEC